MTEASNQVDDALLASRASASSAAYQHQMGTDTERGQSLSLGTCRLALVADYQPQDWMASRHAGLLRDAFTTSLLNWRGLRSASFSRISHWLPCSSGATDRRVLFPSLRSIRRYSPARAVTGCAGAFHSVRFSDCRPSALNTLAHEQTVNSIAQVPHVQVLSKASLRPTHIGRSEKEWRYLISVMRCPK